MIHPKHKLHQKYRFHLKYRSDLKQIIYSLPKSHITLDTMQKQNLFNKHSTIMVYQHHEQIKYAYQHHEKIEYEKNTYQHIYNWLANSITNQSSEFTTISHYLPLRLEQAIHALSNLFNT